MRRLKLRNIELYDAEYWPCCKDQNDFFLFKKINKNSKQFQSFLHNTTKNDALKQLNLIDLFSLSLSVMRLTLERGDI